MFNRINLIIVILFVGARGPAAIAQDAQGNDEAAKLFQKMEERLAKAASLKIALKTEFEGTGEPGGPLMKRELTGKLELADGNRLRFELHKAGAEADEPSVPYWLAISDGRRVLHQ